MTSCTLLGAVLLLTASVAVPAPPTPGTGAASATVVVYRPPVDGAVHVVRAFDPPPQPWLAGHRGVDLAVGPGGTVRAPADGVVTFSGQVAGRGVVTVAHPDGRRSSLEPVLPSVDVGRLVVAGDVLGTTAGDAHGRPEDGPALHWGVREDDRYVDPWELLPGRGPVVLLPRP